MIRQELIDNAGGLTCGLIALALFTIEIVTAHDRKLWIPLPDLLRGSIWITAWLFMIRGITLITPGTPLSSQHMPPFALMTTISLLTTVAGLAWWIVTRSFKDGTVWDRIAYAFIAERQNPSLIPAALSPEDIITLAEAKGIVVMNQTDDDPAP